MCRKKPTDKSWAPRFQQSRQQHQVIIVHPDHVVRPENVLQSVAKTLIDLLVLLPIGRLVQPCTKENSETAARSSRCRIPGRTAPSVLRSEKPDGKKIPRAPFSSTASLSASSTLVPGQPTQRYSPAGVRRLRGRMKIRRETAHQAARARVKNQLAALNACVKRQAVGHDDQSTCGLGHAWLQLILAGLFRRDTISPS